jgi:tetratricopeptide (TPR) repeat protein
MLKKIFTAAVVAAGFTGSVPAASAAYATPATVQADSDVDELMDEGFAMMKVKNYDGAARKFKAVLKLEPRHAEANYRLAWIYNEKTDYDLAMKYAKAAIKANAKDSDAWRELGYAQMKTEQFDEALESLEESIGLNPKNLDAHVYIVAVHKSLGNTDEAADWQKKLDKLKKAVKPAKPTTPDDEDDVPVKPMKKTTKPTKPDADE